MIALRHLPHPTESETRGEGPSELGIPFEVCSDGSAGPELQQYGQDLRGTLGLSAFQLRPAVNGS